MALGAAALPESLVVSWVIPSTYEDGVELPQSEITGFDIYVIKDGEKSYAAWFPWPAANAEYTHAVDGVGEYCFYLITVSKSNGKSEPSETACIMIDEKPTSTNAKPNPPSGLKISIGG